MPPRAGIDARVTVDPLGAPHERHPRPGIRPPGPDPAPVASPVRFVQGPARHRLVWSMLVTSIALCTLILYAVLISLTGYYAIWMWGILVVVLASLLVIPIKGVR